LKIKGRIASLLEVGTGFHPELTGRDNIYLNGAILGMNKAEISRKFDEIVDFAGVERYIGTPVKRYSSGMYVRLAFAVAAFLEPEILIVDEVLAVGDAEFQKKCLGRMKDVSNKEGRTVLFVSHNMQAVANLCTSVIVMQKGKIVHRGSAASGISNYISNFLKQDTCKEWKKDSAPGNAYARLRRAKVSNPISGSITEFDTSSGFVLELDVDNSSGENQQLDFTYHLMDERGTLVTVGSTGGNSQPQYYNNGSVNVKLFFPGNVLNEGIYTFSRILLVKDRGHVLTEWNDLLTFEVLPVHKGTFGWQGQKEGVIKIDDLKWEITTQDAD
jgi:lipopolysaccharide transport system ATP-binding protein